MFRLRVENLTTGQGVVLTDGGTGDLNGANGAITFMGSLGGFTINVTTGLSTPAIGGVNNYAQLHLDSVNVSGMGAGTLRITIEDSGYTMGPEGPLSVAGMIGGVLSGPAGSSVTFQSWANPTGLLPDLGADSPNPTALAALGATPAGSVAVFSPASTFGPGSFNTSGSAEFQRGSDPYSLFAQATIVFTGVGTVSFNSDTSVVPEPTSLVLLGSGLASLGLLGKKKKKTQETDEPTV